ncbi:hypothetical protein FPHYL_5076 [Fusarium phyllophilum]|uniref:Uncharacterized protein n=1 Tax=Fusarium phyllophilum TaxID=47803 RepID=A0A8H5NGA4_9HYPO|nr:hypothetical protein FPHYL_5076 [Fusarium phyllophilum]
MASQIRTRNGLKRPPSGSLKTPESAEKDQQTHECLRQIEEQCELTQENFDYLVKLLIDRSSPNISILPSCDIDGKLFDLTSSNFVAPLFRPISQDWRARVYHIRTKREYVCSTGNGAEGMRTPARTPKNGAQKGWERPSYKSKDIFGNETPTAGNSKRRRIDSAEPMAFDVKEKLEKAASSISNLGLPSVTDLQQEVDERRKERSEHNEVVEKKKKDLERCRTERASQARMHEECEKACTELDEKIKEDERRVREWLAEFPQNLNFQIDFNKYLTPGEDRWKPERDNLMEAQNRKRKANESLDSINQDFSSLERVVENVLGEGRVIEEGVKIAYVRKEFVAMKERHLEDQGAFLSRFEGDDWEKKFDKGAGNMC